MQKILSQNGYSVGVMARRKHFLEELRKEIQNDQLWSALKAVRLNQVYFINEDIMMRPGPRMVDALELLTGYFYPEFFNTNKK
jgi:iron complex transport system substrate-binding protein